MKNLLMIVGAMDVMSVFAGSGLGLLAAVDIDGGRQLFVDDHVLLDKAGVVRHWNAPTKIEQPILKPTSEKEGRIAGCTVATDGGFWWDPTIGKYRLWYETGWCGELRYAESRDGFVWEFPDLGVVKGTNRVFEKDEMDSWSVFPDYQAENPYAKWNLFVSDEGCRSANDVIYTSGDGCRFERLGLSGVSGDRSTMYFDPFRGRWVYSLRDSWDGRSRKIFTSAAFKVGEKPYGWGKDRLPPEEWKEIPHGNLYSFTAVPYESLMLGVFELLDSEPANKWGNADNGACEDEGRPKSTYLQFAFSRDGRTYFPAGAACAIRPSGWGSGKWDTGYLAIAGGVCVIRDERLCFHYSGLQGDATRRTFDGYTDYDRDIGTYYNGALGAATLRRDGFAGLVAVGKGTVLTKKIKFTGGHLFVNGECNYGSIAAEVLDGNRQPIPGFTLADCTAVRYADTTKRELVFKGGDLAKLGDKGVHIIFRLHCATLYSFWISPSGRGESRGYVAAGGPAYPGLRDL